MIFIGTLFGFMRGIWKGFKDPEFRALFLLVLVMVVCSTLFYMKVEKWNLLDAIFFSVITLTTISFGDPRPVTPLGKIFTLIYVIMGISLFLGFIQKISRGITPELKDKGK
jgi:voltage-gated potassium channel